MAALGEFALIDQLLKPLARNPAALGLTDDAAILPPTPGWETVLTTDVLVAGVHYLDSDPAETVGAKALRVNLSDLAAMGAAPLGYLMGLAIPKGHSDAWLADFAAGLAEDQAQFDVSVLGGDITRTPGPMTLSITAVGQVPAGRALRRNGARDGDAVLVSGTIGDAALGLRVLQGDITAGAAVDAALIARYRRPEPRLALGTALRDVATAAIDVSDGLIADMGHIAAESALGAVIEAEKLPVSPAARALLDAGDATLADLLTGGDDYELLVTVPPADVAAAQEKAHNLHIPLTLIGYVQAGAGVAAVDSAGEALAFDADGYTHF